MCLGSLLEDLFLGCFIVCSIHALGKSQLACVDLSSCISKVRKQTGSALVSGGACVPVGSHKASLQQAYL